MKTKLFPMMAGVFAGVSFLAGGIAKAEDEMQPEVAKPQVTTKIMTFRSAKMVTSKDGKTVVTELAPEQIADIEKQIKESGPADGRIHKGKSTIIFKSLACAPAEATGALEKAGTPSAVQITEALKSQGITDEAVLSKVRVALTQALDAAEEQAAAGELPEEAE